MIIPAADLSEQISTAGMEASGTGNMKLALNGALTIGTLDGANIEIRERVGADNIFIFGLTARGGRGAPPPRARRNGALGVADAGAACVEAIEAGVFSPGEPAGYAPLMNALRHDDHFMVAADFDAYFATPAARRRAVAIAVRLVAECILNTANMAGSPPTAPSANTRRTSGGSRSPCPRTHAVAFSGDGLSGDMLGVLARRSEPHSAVTAAQRGASKRIV